MNGALSSAHSNVTGASLLSKAKVAMAPPPSGSVSKLGLVGPNTIVVSGGVPSTTVHSWSVSSGSAASSGTSTRTANVCGPIGRPL